jgi:hypothetical protein
MVTNLRGSVGTGTKEEESSTGRVWAAGFHHVKAGSRLARVFKLMNRFFNFPNFFRAAANRGYGGQPVYVINFTCLLNKKRNHVRYFRWQSC